jgi:hypothetical protein
MHEKTHKTDAATNRAQKLPARPTCRYCLEPLEDWNTDMLEDDACCHCAYKWRKVFEGR